MKCLYQSIALLLLLLLSGCTDKEANSSTTPEPLTRNQHRESYVTEDGKQTERKPLVLNHNSASYATADWKPSDGSELPPYYCNFLGLTNPPTTDVMRDLNDQLQQVGSDLLGRYMGATEETRPIFAQWDCRVLRNDGTYLSVLYTGVIHYGGASPVTEQFSTNYSIGDQAVLLLSLGDLFSPPEKELPALLASKLESLSEGAFTREALQEQLNLSHYYLTEQALGIFYAEDSLEPHAIGILSFDIPMEELADDLIPELMKGVDT